MFSSSTSSSFIHTLPSSLILLILLSSGLAHALPIISDKPPTAVNDPTVNADGSSTNVTPSSTNVKYTGHGKVAGIVVAVLVLVSLSGMGVYFFCWRRRRAERGGVGEVSEVVYQGEDGKEIDVKEVEGRKWEGVKLAVLEKVHWKGGERRREGEWKKGEWEELE